MQSNFRRDYNHRSSNSILNSGRVGRTTRFEYVNRAGEPVSPTTGKPYTRSANSSDGQKRKRPLPIKKTGAMFGGLEPIPTDVTRDPPPRACFNCWQLGHARRNCTRPVVVRMCNNCGRRDEDLHTCPRCNRAHQRYLERLQAKERGEEAGYERSRPASDDEENNGADEFLRNLFYQDQEMRSLLVIQEQMRSEECDKEMDRQKQEGYPLYQEQENGSPFHEGELNVHERVNECLYREDETSLQERGQLRILPECCPRDDALGDRRRSPSPSRLFIRRSPTTPSSSSISSDPVHEILLLAKTIAHLSPDTQDLIMRQVMAERKEQAYRRAMQTQSEANNWC
jgi:hypothetical protein